MKKKAIESKKEQQMNLSMYIYVQNDVFLNRDATASIFLLRNRNNLTIFFKINTKINFFLFVFPILNVSQ